MRRIAARAAGLLTALLIPVVSVLPASASSGPAPALRANASVTAPRLAMASYLADHWASREAPKITVSTGDSLSALAARYLGSARDWPTLWWANHGAVPDPDTITPGTALAFPLTPAPTASLTAKAIRAVPQPEVITTAYAPSGRHYTISYAPPARYSGSGSFQSCVIRAESGGNSQVMNSSGHYGLYQFSFSTWTGHGGAAADFGHASVAEQNQVFESTVRADGDSDWAPYDGCSL